MCFNNDSEVVSIYSGAPIPNHRSTSEVSVHLDVIVAIFVLVSTSSLVSEVNSCHVVQRDKPERQYGGVTNLCHK